MLIGTTVWIVMALVFGGSIYLLVSSIKSQNRKLCVDNLAASLLGLVYVYCFVPIMIVGLGATQSLSDIIRFMGIGTLITIALLVAIIVNIVKIARKKIKYEPTNNLIYYGLALAVLVGVMGYARYYEEVTRRGADVLLTYKYGEMFNIEYTTYAVRANGCAQVTALKGAANLNGEDKYYMYKLEYKGATGQVLLNTQEDVNATRLNYDKATRIVQSEMARRGRNNDIDLMLYQMGVDYYVLRVGRDDFEVVYNGEDYVCKIQPEGWLDSVEVLEY